MATQTLRPNATVSAGTWARTGGTTKHGVLADDSDATYLKATDTTEAVFNLTSYVLAAGERVKRIRTRARVRLDSGVVTPSNVYVRYRSPAAAATIATHTVTSSTFATFTGGWLGELLAAGDQQALIDALRGSVQYSIDAMPGPEFAELYVDLDVWARTDAPTVTSDPSGTITDTDVPTIESYTTANDGTPSEWSRQVRVFRDAVYLAGGFDPETETDVEWEQTDTALGSISTDSGAPDTVQVGEPLANSDTYRAYVRYGKNGVAGETLWSEWGHVEFTLDLTLPSAPGIDVTVDSPQGRQVVTVTTAALTHDTAEQLEVQRSVDGGAWTAIRGGTLTEVAASTVYTFHDYDADRGVTVAYRARVTEGLTASGGTITSDWTTTGTVAHPNDGTVWIYTVPDFATVIADAPVVADPTVEILESVGVFRPPGRKHAVVVTSGVVHGEDVALQIVADGDDADDVKAALTHPGALLVKWADGTQQYLRPIRRQMTRGDLGDQIHRMWNVGTVETGNGYTEP